MQLTLIERIATGRPLTPTEHDQNLQAIEASVNTLEASMGVALNPDGTLKSGAVSTTDKLNNRIVTLDKLAASESNKGKWLRYNPTTGEPEAATFPVIDKPTPYMLLDHSTRKLAGAQANTVLGSWTLSGVPAGQITAVCQLHFRNDEYNAPTGGSVFLKINDVLVASMNTHFLKLHTTNIDTRIPCHMIGHLANFAGGTALVQLVVDTQESGFNATYGIENGDSRFSAKVLLTAGF